MLAHAELSPLSIALMDLDAVHSSVGRRAGPVVPVQAVVGGRQSGA